jgi:hypothetical protein
MVITRKRCVMAVDVPFRQTDRMVSINDQISPSLDVGIHLTMFDGGNATCQRRGGDSSVPGFGYCGDRYSFQRMCQILDIR